MVVADVEAVGVLEVVQELREEALVVHAGRAVAALGRVAAVVARGAAVVALSYSKRW